MCGASLGQPGRGDHEPEHEQRGASARQLHVPAALSGSLSGRWRQFPSIRREKGRAGRREEGEWERASARAGEREKEREREREREREGERETERERVQV